MVGDEDHGALLDRDRDPLRDRLRPLLPRLHVLPPLSEQLDQWTEWLVRTRYEGRTREEYEEMVAQLALIRERVLGNARLQPGTVVADVGAGTGLLTLAAAEQVAPDGDVFALDISADALEELRRAARSPNIFYFIGAADVLPLTDASVDVVLTRSVLIYVDDKPEAGREFFRVLREGGRVSIFEPINSRNTRLSDVIDFGPVAAAVRQWEDARRARRDDPMLNFDERDLECAFVDAGFVDVQLEFRSVEHELTAERLLTTVGAPGRLSLRDEWSREFTPAEVEQLVDAVHAQSPVHLIWSHVYLTARKP